MSKDKGRGHWAWIKQALIDNNYDKIKVQSLYEDFKQQTGADTLRKSYVDTVTKIAKGSITVNTDEFGTAPLNDSVIITEDTNSKNIVSKSKRIKSLADLVEQCEIDLNIWTVDHHKINKWESGAKIEGEIVVTPLFQVEAKLTKKVPDEVKFPIVQPININISHYSTPIKYDIPPSTFKKALIVPDSQNGYRNEYGKLISFHDRRCWDLMMQINRLSHPDLIIFLGDMLDMAEWSEKFSKEKEFYFTTQASLIELGWLISQLRYDNPSAKMVYIEGNHEKRFEKLYVNHLIQGYDLRRFNTESQHATSSIPYLLNLESLNMQYCGPYPRKSEFWINDNLVAEHGSVVKQGSGDTVKNILQETRCSKIVGHIHRREEASKTVYAHRGGISYTVCSPGTIAKLDGTVPSYSGKENWQQGFAEVMYEEGNGLFKIDNIPIVDGKVIYKENLLIGTDKYVEQLNEDVKDTKITF